MHALNVRRTANELKHFWNRALYIAGAQQFLSALGDGLKDRVATMQRQYGKGAIQNVTPPRTNLSACPKVFRRMTKWVAHSAETSKLGVFRRYAADVCVAFVRISDNDALKTLTDRCRVDGSAKVLCVEIDRRY